MKICLHSLHKIFHNPTYKADFCSGCKEYIELNRFRLWTRAKIRIEVDAIVYDAPVLMYYANTAGRGRTKLAGSIFHQEFYGIAMPSGSPLREEINRTLLEIMSDGTYSNIYEKWFGQRPGESK